MKDFSRSYVCGTHGILEHRECVAKKTTAQYVRRVLLVREAFKWVMRRDGFKCHWCLRMGSKRRRPLTVDHLIPLSRGGTNVEDNLVLACGPCNNVRSNRMPDDPEWTTLLEKIRAGLILPETLTRLLPIER